MVRKAEHQKLEVNIPTLFRCPISLDVMTSPVSLSTGVSYDRASIQRWLDSGNATCPVTMQPLATTDLIPNLTLRRLIRLWCAADPDLDLLTSAARLRRAAAFLADPDADDFAKNSLAAGCAAALPSFLAKDAEAATEILDLILSPDLIEAKNKRIAITSLAADLGQSAPALVNVVKNGSNIQSRAAAARVLDSVVRSVADPEAEVRIAEQPDLLRELIRLARAGDRAAVGAAVSCLAGIALHVRRTRVQMVQLGIVPAATRVLAMDPAVAAEAAMGLLEAASGCAEGREAICEEAERCVGAVLARMVKMGTEGTESAVAVLWSVCHLFRDRRAQEAVAATGGGIGKLLVVMQSGCSPATRQMAGDLLRIFRVNCKSCLLGYDTKTMHIMPF